MIAEALMGSKSTSTYRKKWEMNVLSDQNQAGKDCYIQSCLWYGGNKSASLPAKIRVLSPFQVEELLDAVSVLYNGKASADDWSILVNNFEAKGFKAHFVYLSSKLTLKNLTQVDYRLKVYEFTTRKNTDQDVGSVFKAHISDTKFASDPYIDYDNDLGWLRMTEGVEFSDFNQSDFSMKSYYKDFKVGTVVSFTDIEKDFKIDFTKMVNENGSPSTFFKGSKHYVFKLEPYIAWASVTNRDEGNATRYYPYAYDRKYGIACTWDKVFKVLQPGS
jgi:hypothetical protein